MWLLGWMHRVPLGSRGRIRGHNATGVVAQGGAAGIGAVVISWIRGGASVYGEGMCRLMRTASGAPCANRTTFDVVGPGEAGLVESERLVASRCGM